MATSSMMKDFVINDQKAYEQLKKDLETEAKDNTCHQVKASTVLSYGEEKLKDFYNWRQ